MFISTYTGEATGSLPFVTSVLAQAQSLQSIRAASRLPGTLEIREAGFSGWALNGCALCTGMLNRDGTPATLFVGLSEAKGTVRDSLKDSLWVGRPRPVLPRSDGLKRYDEAYLSAKQTDPRASPTKLSRDWFKAATKIWPALAHGTTGALTCFSLLVDIGVLALLLQGQNAQKHQKQLATYSMLYYQSQSSH